MYKTTNPNLIPERYPKVFSLFSGLDRGKLSKPDSGNGGFSGYVDFPGFVELFN